MTAPPPPRQEPPRRRHWHQLALALSYHATECGSGLQRQLTCSSEPEELRLASRDLARQADQYGLSLALLHQGARLLRPSLSTFRLKFRVGHGPFRGSSY